MALWSMDTDGITRDYRYGMRMIAKIWVFTFSRKEFRMNRGKFFIPLLMMLGIWMFAGSISAKADPMVITYKR
jgi:hypothetical protein